MRSAILACLLLAVACAAPAFAASQAEEDSVFSWGRWQTLNPAAGGLPAPAPVLSVQGVDLRPEDSQQLAPRLQPTGGGGGTPPAGPPSVPGVVPVDPNQPVGSGPPSPPPPPPAGPL